MNLATSQPGTGDKKAYKKLCPASQRGIALMTSTIFLVNYFFFFLAAAFFFFLVAIVRIPPFVLDFVWPLLATQVLVYFLLQNCQRKTVF